MADPIEDVVRALARPGRETSDFDLNPGIVLPAGRVLRPAAVLVPLIGGPRGLEVILTKRSSRLKHHPGQIAFPGGKVDETDANGIAAALRETHEEIGLPEDNVEILGTMAPHETVTGFTISPVLGRVRAKFEARAEAGEVDEVFAVPLSHVTDATKFAIERRRWRGEWRRYYVVPYGPYYIWGATARILRALADRMA
ncbi:putative Nudix hydrolase NudL [Defluviimonas aquaemixtae]|uniref:Putative Nudix hydrolase NudL n=1 Tax=Albidovulum aquaemixtae TaxID=1542388 RepID=A0A2R8BJJ2_9RHOB|nr:CoA pyrophosphatase [Defluviimonas aquaemixtae]SPH23581.1 putative Nudix hydrolase NudL [Defluviimonas aquaemixtae]